MAFVTAVPVGSRTQTVNSRSSRLSDNVVKAMATPVAGRSSYFQRFMDSAKVSKWTEPDPSPSPPPPGTPEGRSSVFFNFMQSQGADFPGGPTEVPKSFGLVQDTLTAASTAYFRGFVTEAMRGYGAGGFARDIVQTAYTCRVDDYIADCARRQYIQAQNSSGVFGQSCTEGTVKGAAEESRVAALAAKFRRGQVPTAASLADLYETRRLATALANGCSYEESLVQRFYYAAEATVVGTTEKLGACSRYSNPANEMEKFMASCVERAASARATPTGVYGVRCCDGTTEGAAEAKRVACLATKYRNSQMNGTAKEQIKFNQSKFARDYFSGGCTYEDDFFTQHPAVAACMRPDFARY